MLFWLRSGTRQSSVRVLRSLTVPYHLWNCLLALSTEPHTWLVPCTQTQRSSESLVPSAAVIIWVYWHKEQKPTWRNSSKKGFIMKSVGILYRNWEVKSAFLCVCASLPSLPPKPCSLSFPLLYPNMSLCLALLPLQASPWLQWGWLTLCGSHTVPGFSAVLLIQPLGLL